MAARGILQHVLLDTTGAPIPNRAVQILKPDGTAFAGTFYDAVSGGSTVGAGATTSNADGLVQYWTPFADIKRALVRTSGATDTLSQFAHDPEDVIVQGMTVPAVLDGYSGTGWAQTIKSAHVGGGVASQIARFLDSNDDAYLRIWRSSGGNQAVSINLVDGTIPTLSTFEVKKASGTTGFNAVTIEQQVTAAGIIQAGLQVTAKQTVAGQSNAIGIRAITERSASASADGVGYAVEGQVKTSATSSDPSFSVGFYANSAIVTSGVRSGAAFFAGGAGTGWSHGFLYRDSASATLASIDQLGNELLGNGTVLLPSRSFVSDPDTGIYRIAANTLGFATNATEALRIDTAAVTAALPFYLANGTAAAPSMAFANSTATGLYRAAGNNIGIATAGVARAVFDQAGNFYIGTSALATNATNGFFMIPTCAGTPTGVPPAYTGVAAMIYDSTANKFWMYDGGWVGVALT